MINKNMGALNKLLALREEAGTNKLMGDYKVEMAGGFWADAKDLGDKYLVRAVNTNDVTVYIVNGASQVFPNKHPSKRKTHSAVFGGLLGKKGVEFNKVSGPRTYFDYFEISKEEMVKIRKNLTSL